MEDALPLALLELRVFLVDDVEFAFSANNFAVNRALLDGRSDFHIVSSCLFAKSVVFNGLSGLFVAVDDAPSG
jgi:predicted solute-binding protein